MRSCMCDAHGGDGKALMKNLSIRLKAYKPNGDTLGLLPQPSSFSASFLHDDTGALRLEYSRKALNGSILERKLETGLEIAVEVSDGGKWLEPLNGRFVLISRSRDALDSSDTVTFTCPSYAWLLNKALMLDLAHLEGDGDDKGKRVFKKASAGLVMRTFLDENKTRGGIPVTCGFDTGRDSAGAAWKSVMTLAYTPGISSLTALANLAGNKICDWAFDKRTLKIWNMDSTALCRDLSRISVQLAHDVLEAPEEESIEALASHILVQGDNNKAFTRDNPAAPSPWGKWETYLSQQGISDDDTAALYMQSTLDTAARVRGQYTRALRVNDAPSLPLVDYRPGDWITAPTVMHGEKVRVQQVTLSLESNQFKASVVLNDKVYDATVRQAKRVQGITGGAINGGTGGGLPAPEKDHRTPKAVTGLVVQTDAYISSRGTALGLATLQWAAVSHATDDTAIDIGSYRVEYRKNLAGAPWVSGGVTDAQRLTIGIGGLECGARYEFRVRAVPTYSDRLGEWSNVVVALVASDVTPPSIPSKPIPTSRYGIVDVQWDGRNNVNAGMEPDFDHCELGVSESNGNWQYRDSVARDGHCIVTGLTAYKTYWFALRSVDRSGNKSGWSAGVSVVVQSAVSPEEVKRIQQDLADNKTALQDNTAKLDQARKDIQANKSDLDTANRTLTQAKADLSQARKDIAQTKSDLTTANGEISKAKESAAQAYAEAHSKNHTFRGPDMPDASKGLIVGDLWLKTQKYWTRWQGTPNNSPSMLADFYTYWTGTPNNSPSVLVPLSDRVIDTLVWDGSNWNHLGYADVEKNADEISKAKSDIADNAAKTTDAKKAAENAAAAAKNAQGTADSAKSAAGTAQSTADAANAAAKSATTTAGQAKDAANAANAAAESAKKTAGNAETLANTANTSASAAKSDAASAKTDASDAKATASNASSVATQAKATADSAAQSATDAATAARKANTAAAAAAGVANGKADVLIQSTAPDTSMRKPTTLWIDTTGGANTPKRWNGSAWAAVTDKAATDAANAAVKANDAAKTAQSTADKAATAAANAASQANQAQAAAKKAQTTADGKNLIYRGPDEPAHDGLKPGDMWWRTQKYWTRWQGEPDNSPSMLADFYTYWQGAPNASPSVLVPLADRVVEVLTWDGTRFTPFDLVANNILAAGTVSAKHLTADSVTAEKVKANAVTADKIAANSVTTEKLVSDAVTAAKLAADSVQARNIVSLAITTDKLAANSVTTAKLRVTEDMTVALLNVHKIQAGDIVAGAVTADKIAANAVNADKLAANSVNASKIVSGAITVDKLAANSVTAVKIAAGTITSDKVAAGQFRGYVFTGAVFQSSEAANTGVKLNSMALQMWDSSHNQTVYLDGDGKSNLLTGTFQTSLTGRRVVISPTFRQSIINSDDKTEGSGIEFQHGRSGHDAYIASESRTNYKGDVSTIVINGGQLNDTDPGSFMRLGEYKAADNATKTGDVFLAAYRNYARGGQDGYAQLFLQADPTSKYHTSAELSARDPNGVVGVHADINSGYLYLGGFLGWLGEGRGTFRTYYPRGGSLSAGGWITQTWTYGAPAKYGLYHAHVSADSMGSIAVGSNNDSPSGCNLWARGVGNGNGTPYGYQILAILAKQ
nr:MAG TPA: FN3 [Caudoviricetes sp.]